MGTSPKFDAPFDDLMLDAPAPATSHSEPCACGLVQAGVSIHVYNEEAFRYFLEIERKRSELSNRPFLLLLVDVRKRSGGSAARINPAAADKLFSALAACLRETDFVGWYRTATVVGAVLTQHTDFVAPDIQEAVRVRVAHTIGTKVPADFGKRVQVRVYQVPPVGQANE